MNSDDFREEITLKPYLKYQYQIDLGGRKSTEKTAFLEAINGLNIDHIYGLNLLVTKGLVLFLS